jgi:hypothetical protein
MLFYAVISNLMNMPIGEAKLLVHGSKIWQDVRRRDEEIHEEFYSALEKSDGEE